MRSAEETHQTDLKSSRRAERVTAEPLLISAGVKALRGNISTRQRAQTSLSVMTDASDVTQTGFFFSFFSSRCDLKTTTVELNC